MSEKFGTLIEQFHQYVLTFVVMLVDLTKVMLVLFVREKERRVGGGLLEKGFTWTLSGIYFGGGQSCPGVMSTSRIGDGGCFYAFLTLPWC